MGKKKEEDKVRIEIIGAVANTVTGSGTLISFYDYMLNKDINICCDLGIQQDGTIYENYKSNFETLERLDVKALDYCLTSHCHRRP